MIQIAALERRRDRVRKDFSEHCHCGTEGDDCSDDLGEARAVSQTQLHSCRSRRADGCRAETLGVSAIGFSDG